MQLHSFRIEFAGPVKISYFSNNTRHRIRATLYPRKCARAQTGVADAENLAKEKSLDMINCLDGKMDISSISSEHGVVAKTVSEEFAGRYALHHFYSTHCVSPSAATARFA